MTTVTNLTPWAYHGIFDCANCDSTAIQTESTIRSCLTELSSIVGDGPVGETYMAITGAEQTDKEGFSATQLLEIGSITAKFVKATKNIYIDIVSCNEFAGTNVEDTIRKYFGDGVTINKIMLPRNANAQAPQ